jgi:hypothetical protein
VNQSRHLEFDTRDVPVGLLFGVDLQRLEVLGQAPLASADSHIQHVAERMGRIGRNHEAAAAAIGCRDCEGCGNGRLADAAFASDEQESAIENAVQD